MLLLLNLPFRRRLPCPRRSRRPCRTRRQQLVHVLEHGLALLILGDVGNCDLHGVLTGDVRPGVGARLHVGTLGFDGVDHTLGDAVVRSEDRVELLAVGVGGVKDGFHVLLRLLGLPAHHGDLLPILNGEVLGHATLTVLGRGDEHALLEVRLQQIPSALKKYLALLSSGEPVNSSILNGPVAPSLSLSWSMSTCLEPRRPAPAGRWRSSRRRRCS